MHIPYTNQVPPSTSNSLKSTPTPLLFNKAKILASRVWSVAKNNLEEIIQITYATSILGNALPPLSDIPTHMLRCTVLGTLTGISTLGLAISIDRLFRHCGMEVLGKDEKKEREYTQSISIWTSKKIIAISAWEEILFRNILQDPIKKVLQVLLSQKASGNNLLTPKHAASLMAILATSSMFGLAHLGNGIGLSKIVYTTAGGVIFGFLKEKEGPLASVVAHSTLNLIASKM